MRAYWLGLAAAIAGLILSVHTGYSLVLAVIFSLSAVLMLGLMVWDHRQPETWHE